MFGGELRDMINEDDPYLIESRGLWFDGNEKFAKIR
jgi:hypothetical protein